MAQQRFYTVCQKTGPMHYCNKILKEIMKCSTIQHENANRGHAANIIATKLQNGVPFHGHNPEMSPFISCLITTFCCTPDQTVLRRCCSWSFKSFKSHLNWSLSIFLLQILSRICQLQFFKLIQILNKIKCDSLCTDPLPWLAKSGVDGCNGNKVSWYPVLSKFISYKREN